MQRTFRRLLVTCHILSDALGNDVAHFAEAEHLLKQVIRELEERTEMEEQVDLLAEAKSALSGIYWDSGRWDEHDRLLEEVFLLHQRRLGVEHPSVLRAAAYRVYDLQGRFGDLRAAEELDRQVHEASVRVLGFEDAGTRILRYLEAGRLASKGLWGRSLALHRETRDRGDISRAGRFLVQLAADDTADPYSRPVTGIWDLETMRLVRRFDHNSHAPRFTKDGQRVITVGAVDGLTKIWDIRDLVARPRLLPTERGIETHWNLGTLQFSPSVKGPWTDLPAASPFPLSPVGKRGFFRVKIEE